VAHDPGADLDHLPRSVVSDHCSTSCGCAGSWRGCRRARGAGAAPRCAAAIFHKLSATESAILP
jgi:hypothetical protein